MHKGQFHSKETKARISEAKKKTWSSSEYRARMSAIMTSPETRARRSEAMIKKWKDPEYKLKRDRTFSNPEVRSRMSEATKEVMKDPKARLRYSKATKKGMANPEVRKKLSMMKIKYFANPDIRLKHSAIANKRWSNPENRARIAKSVLRYLSSGKSRGKGRTYDTSIELKMEELLLNMGINYKKQINIEDIACVDFFIPENNTIIECFGDYWHNKENIKTKDERKRILLENRGYELLIFWEHDINNNIDKVELVLDVMNNPIRTGLYTIK
jgi:very-short-patch-repair endonuclease